MRSKIGLLLAKCRVPCVIALLVLAVEVSFLVWAKVIAGELGYPLDDAWIHQVFARNLVGTGTLAFNPGVPSSGVTSLAWSAIIAIGYLLEIEPRIWIFLVGIIAHWTSGLLVYAIARRIIPEPKKPLFALLAACFTVVELHLVWASLSGMETTFFTMLSLLLVYLHMRGTPWSVQGFVAGLLTATRTEGVLLFGLILMSEWCHVSVRSLLYPLLGWAIVETPVFLFNWIVGGSLLPNTYTAKVVLAGPQPQAGIIFLLMYLALLFIGLNVLLIPAVLFLIQSHREEKKPLALPLAWVGGLTLLYAVFFPIVHHNMRYLLPTLPWLVILGSAGIALLYRQKPAVAKLHLIVNTAALLPILVLGTDRYAWDVQNINDQQVMVGKWLGTHTPSNAVIATDDIGAIGYFANRQVVDLAGLVTPEVIGYLRAGESEAPYICARGVTYLAIFLHDHPDFQRKLVLQEVYRRHLERDVISQGADMIVFQVLGCSITSGNNDPY